MARRGEYILPDDDNHNQLDFKNEMLQKDDNFRRKYPSTWRIIVSIMLVAALFVVGVLLGYFVRGLWDPKAFNTVHKSCDNDCVFDNGIQFNPIHLQELHQEFVNRISHNDLSFLLSDFEALQISSDTQNDAKLLKFIQSRLADLKFDQVDTHKYNVLLSRPIKQNTLRMVTEKGDILEEYSLYNDTVTTGVRLDDLDQEAVHDSGSGSPSPEGTYSGVWGRDVVTPFVAYSPPGIVHAEPLYLHYGQSKDYDLVIKKGINVTDKIVIVRYGKSTLQDKIKQVSRHGSSAILLYFDPEDNSPEGRCTDTAPWSHINSKLGDPLTPGYPSTGNTWTHTVNPSHFSPIPVQTIPCTVAEKILVTITGQKAPTLWNGGFYFDYYIGRKSKRDATKKLKLEVYNEFIQGTVSNIIVTIQGKVNPDQHVLLGANRNSFLMGPQSGLPGTSMLLELARNLEYLITEEGWVPSRTINLCFWGGAEYGDIGMMEFLEEYGSALSRQVVGYLDLDLLLQGHRTLDVTATASLSDLIYFITKQSSFNPHNITADSPSLYNFWQDSAGYCMWSPYPLIHHPYTTSHSSLHSSTQSAVLKCPAVHLQFVDRTKTRVHYPLVQEFYNHQSLTQLHSLTQAYAQLMLSLADAIVLQINSTQTVMDVQFSTEDVLEKFRDHIFNNTLHAIEQTILDLKQTTPALQYYIVDVLQFHQTSTVRRLNEKLLRFEFVATDVFLHLKRIKHMKIPSSSKTKTMEDEHSHDPENEVTVTSVITAIMSTSVSPVSVADVTQLPTVTPLNHEINVEFSVLLNLLQTMLKVMKIDM